MNKNCEYCDREFEGTATQKYCGDLCKELAGVERRLGVELDFGDDRLCDVRRCMFRRKYITKERTGWYIRVPTGRFGTKSGFKINYCPACGGRLELTG